MRILIAEDDFASRVVIKTMLEPYGDCDVVVNGKEVIEAFQLALMENNPYDLLCLDIMMPKMDGREALKWIRQIEKENKVAPRDEAKIVMTTALGTPRDVIDAYYSGGCTSYIVKPLTKEKIRNILNELGLLTPDQV
ncbi:MAG TPA: response regulator [Ignavibacteriales bacterium]|nr:response regulator [Ignavibacteriales bacterium]